jgi:anti-sigma factor RsiW
MERDDTMDRDEWDAEGERQRELARWFDGELPEDRRPEVEARLRRDPEATQHLESFEAVRSVIRSRPRPAAPAGFAGRVVRAALGGSESPWAVLEPFVRRLALAASVLLLVSIGVWLALRDADVDRSGATYRLSAGLPRSAMERAMLGEEWGPLWSLGARENER